MNAHRFGLARGVAVAVVAAVAPFAHGGITPFTEDFDADASAWFNAAGTATVDWLSGGGPGGAADAHVTTTFDFSNASADDPFVLFRGQDEFNSSGGAFVGDWISGGVSEFSFWVRHHATEPISFFARIAGPDNFPGVNAIAFTPVAPNTWTLISFAIEPDNPAFIFEGPSSTFTSVFGNVGHVQIGMTTPEGLDGGGVFSFDLDAVSIVPSPPAVALLCGALFIGARRRRC